MRAGPDRPARWRENPARSRCCASTPRRTPLWRRRVPERCGDRATCDSNQIDFWVVPTNPPIPKSEHGPTTLAALTPLSAGISVRWTNAIWKFESSQPSQPVRSPRVKVPRRRKTTRCAAYRGYGLVSVSGFGLPKRHSGAWSRRPLFGVPFSGAPIDGLHYSWRVPPALIMPADAPVVSYRIRQRPRQ
jgi:hypothetical protein